jgi:hypothetical protein
VPREVPDNFTADETHCGVLGRRFSQSSIRRAGLNLISGGLGGLLGQTAARPLLGRHGLDDGVASAGSRKRRLPLSDGRAQEGFDLRLREGRRAFQADEALTPIGDVRPRRERLHQER